MVYSFPFLCDYVACLCVTDERKSPFHFQNVLLKGILLYQNFIIHVFNCRCLSYNKALLQIY